MPAADLVVIIIVLVVIIITADLIVVIVLIIFVLVLLVGFPSVPAHCVRDQLAPEGCPANRTCKMLSAPLAERWVVA